jgi:hypothetical protein
LPCSFWKRLYLGECVNPLVIFAKKFSHLKKEMNFAALKEKNGKGINAAVFLGCAK